MYEALTKLAALREICHPIDHSIVCELVFRTSSLTNGQNSIRKGKCLGISLGNPLYIYKRVTLPQALIYKGPSAKIKLKT